jgi:hypothetical protein
MRPETAKALFAADVAHLAAAATAHRLRDVRLLGPFQATLLVRRGGRDIRLVLTASDHYPLDPLSVQFCDPANPTDTGTHWWPRDANGINADQRFVCTLGVLEGHRQHPAWPIQTRKNRIEAVVDQVTRAILKVEAWPEVVA